MFTNIRQILYFCLRSLRYVEARAPFTPWETDCRPQHKNGCGVSFGFFIWLHADSTVWACRLTNIIIFFFVVNRHLVVLVLPMGLQWWVQSQCALQSACRLCLLHLPHFQRQVLDSIWHGRPGVFGLRHWDTPFLVIHRPLPSRGEGCGVSTRGEFGKLHLR